MGVHYVSTGRGVKLAISTDLSMEIIMGNKGQFNGEREGTNEFFTLRNIHVLQLGNFTSSGKEERQERRIS
ncbi:unnamed protein product [Onchocerca ochengi]|uniref:Dirigent protein n=1 Tax=Onchocerca ochengi TaxID=42157 RepID=A0A182EVD3_ONCOC|nr:unnamed protein product [Onchocerca ochengi]